MEKAKPWRIKCLRAVEGLLGGRQELADRLSLSRAAIDRWIREERLPQDYIGKLIELSHNRFTADDFLGLKDERHD